MKETFHKINKEKRQLIINACIEEFGENGYEKSSISNIVRRCGISKGGLYEYTSSKEELFVFIVEYSYETLYNYITANTGKPLSEDILTRLREVSDTAVDFYIENPGLIKLITQTNSIQDNDLSSRINNSFIEHFNSLFKDCNTSEFSHKPEKTFDLLRWLLLKTRNEFLSELNNCNDTKIIKESYIKNWEFYISVLESGIFKNNNAQK